MPVERATRQAWLIWTTAVVIYFAAIFHRASLGVASLEAGERFGVGPAALSTFTVLQVGVYAVMQVPTGLLVDRFGPRRVLTAAAVLLGLGQALFAVADSYPLGLAARAVLGLGDALTWVSVLRLVAAHFPARRYALVVSLSGALGAAGNLAATLPLTVLLDSAGWTVTFLVAGLATAAYSARAAWRLRDVPAGMPAPTPEPIYPREVVARVAVSWRTPGTRLGFWVHFSTGVLPSTLGLLWGFPYLVEAQGLSPESASAVLTLLVFGGLFGGPVIGAFTARRPELRMPVATGFLTAAGLAWLAMLAWPGQLPAELLTVVFLLLSLGGPISAIGFALARDYNPFRRVGTATGVVNVGGFVATTISALAVGLLLDLAEPLGPGTAYRVALLAVAAVLGLGAWRTLVWWRRARAVVFAAQARGEEVPVQLRPRRWDVLPATPALAPA
ncbi:MFS transporter [Longimycelium tulufanense]|uniref:MFS transporter n=1 Tax=Longimycelium tulufanense TaxID=907463 RepID=A0A8J3C9B4_9PSEU|nr:MFS transporter [Longimycelium tulufanense]GGM38443.1 MFS transporter [Longimycelium tulufanense]